MNKQGTHNPNYRHGLCSHPAYKRWADMVARCSNESHAAFADYGGRGIRVCPEWHTFARFWKDMGPTYQKELQLDRKDNDGDYSPDNCRWVTCSENCRNKRNNVVIETPAGQMTVCEAAQRFQISAPTIYSRVARGRDPFVRLRRSRSKV